MSCPVFEALYEGTRGPGKTDALIMDFAQFVGRGHGDWWRGILFRRTYKELDDIVAKTRRWFRQIFPDATFNQADYRWTFPDGEQLLLRYMLNKGDYWSYHGHEYPWIGWEEITSWPNKDCYEMMMSCCRSSGPNIPKHYRATCNPYGIGHNWVKARFIDPAPAGTIIEEEDFDPHGNKRVRERVRIHGELTENKVLQAADPEYIFRLNSITDPVKRAAWIHGSWDIVAGGMFDDVWDPSVHIIDPFDIPSEWRVDRSFDWGSATPFSVGWWAESDGSDVELKDGTILHTIRGDLFRIGEWYGWDGEPNEGCRMLATNVAKGILEREAAMGRKVRAGPADTQIYNVEQGRCLADDMALTGVNWVRADKTPGSRKTGIEQMRDRFERSKNGAAPREKPGLFVFNTCRHFIRTIPVLSRSERDPDDIAEDLEDHVFDETRYRVRTPKREIVATDLEGY